MAMLNENEVEDIVNKFWAEFCTMRAGQALGLGGEFDAPLSPPAHWLDLARFAADLLILPAGQAAQLIRRFAADVLDVPGATGVTASLVINLPNPRNVHSFRATPMGKLLETAVVRVLTMQGNIMPLGEAKEALSVPPSRLAVMLDNGTLPAYFNYAEPNPILQRVTSRPHVKTYVAKEKG